MSLAGSLEIGLEREGAQVTAVRICSSRPLQVVDVFHDKPVEQVLEMLPRLYSVCGTAQAMAAATACEQALQVELPASQVAARKLLLTAETAREHMARILLDWPEFADGHSQPLSSPLVGGLMQRLLVALYPRGDGFHLGGGALKPDARELSECIGELHRYVGENIFGAGLDAWLDITDETELRAWAASNDTTASVLLRGVMLEEWAGFGRSSVPGLPPLSDAELHARLETPAADSFIRAPSWSHGCCETSAYTRQHDQPLVAALRSRYGNGLLPRLVARLQELAAGLETLRRRAPALRDDPGGAGASRSAGTGLAQVEAARGRLVHRVEISAGRVKRYQVLAPTEWNFHPHGLLAQSLEGCRQPDAETLYRQAGLLVNAIDPCVAYRIQVH